MRACAAQAQRLPSWGGALAERTWAVEGPGWPPAVPAAGRGRGRVLYAPPKLGARVRLLGSGRIDKNDPNDARSVAIAALRRGPARWCGPMTTRRC